MHYDYARHAADVTPFTDGALLRRAQLGVVAKYHRSWSAKVVYDFASGGAFKDAYLRYQGWQSVALIAGQFKVPFGLEQLASTNDLPFIERSLASDAFALSRRRGFGFETHSGHHTFSAMGFGSAIGGVGGKGVAARFTYAPVDNDKTVVHFGLAGTSEQPATTIKVQARPESLPTDPRLVKTKNLVDVARITQLGVEAAWERGPFTLQTEWMGAYLNRTAGRTDPTFTGWYVAGSWVLTGESRGYALMMLLLVLVLLWFWMRSLFGGGKKKVRAREEEPVEDLGRYPPLQRPP